MSILVGERSVTVLADLANWVRGQLRHSAHMETYEPQTLLASESELDLFSIAQASPSNQATKG